jgi:hypothetical protein
MQVVAQLSIEDLPDRVRALSSRRWRALRASTGVPLVRGTEPGRWRALRASTGVPLVRGTR